ncbi:NosD domain-containing protein [Kamptonema cortianum]|nr:NosD domain-containing protein [Geitlerinema splendidum]MDK3155938.1 NosD domain-containing protein [Kamptonema cortianum]
MNQAEPLPVITPKSGLIITESCRIAPGTYDISSGDTDGTSAAITVKGKNITVDFAGCTLRGTPSHTEPDARKGTCLRVEGENITLQNMKIHGYKSAVIARNTPRLTILDSDLSFNWKQRLGSTQEKEDLADWMSFHKNDNNEWLRFGAAIYLDDCDEFEIKGVVANGGQCGLMMTKSDRGLAWNNDFSFLSAVGIGMYRSSDNRIMHNKIDWCVRGYSHGVYNRGQDSTGILIYEQSHRNTFAYNSVTHSGDGFFLWAGQTTMDTGEGGCNDNIVYANDFSHAPTNAIESTFSRNTYVNNLLLENWHGVWGGYSYDTKIIGNVFGLNGEAIAIEHGQDNEIVGNVFRRDTVGVMLWSNLSQDPNWGYPKHRDTRSRDTDIHDNVFFTMQGPIFDLKRTSNVSIQGNFIKRFNSLFLAGDGIENLTFGANTIWSFMPIDTSKMPWLKESNPNDWQIDSSRIPVQTYMARGGLTLPAVDSDPAVMQRIWNEMEWSPFRKPLRSSKSTDQMSPEELRDHHSAPYYVAPLDEGISPFIRPGERRGRQYILVDEWGPYDFKSPVLWPKLTRTESDRMVITFEVLGPEGEWKLIQKDSLSSVSANSGKVGDVITVAFPITSGSGWLNLTCEYVGKETRNYRGEVTPAGLPVPFGYRKYFLPMVWDVKFFHYDLATQDPRTHVDAFARVLLGSPVQSGKMNELNGAWSGSPAPGVNPNHFATVAETEVQVPEGEYILSVTSDDGIRVWVDGKLVIEDWTWHAPKTDTVKLKLGGKHRIKVHHFELDGYSTLKVTLKPS